MTVHAVKNMDINVFLSVMNETESDGIPGFQIFQFNQIYYLSFSDFFI